MIHTHSQNATLILLCVEASPPSNSASVSNSRGAIIPLVTVSDCYRYTNITFHLQSLTSVYTSNQVYYVICNLFQAVFVFSVVIFVMDVIYLIPSHVCHILVIAIALVIVYVFVGVRVPMSLFIHILLYSKYDTYEHVLTCYSK